jgi:hypothetical protein
VLTYDFTSYLYPNRKPIEEAFRYYTHPDDLADLDQAFADEANGDAGDISPYKLQLELIKEFQISELQSGRCTAFGLKLPLEPSSQFETISRAMWGLLQIDSSDVGHWTARVRGLELMHIHVSGPRPEWIYDKPASSQAPEFSHDETYSSVKMRDQVFELSAIPAAIVRLLHESALRGEPSLEGKQLLHNAGSDGANISDQFKRFENWGELIKRVGKGRFRLNLNGSPIVTSDSKESKA